MREMKDSGVEWIGEIPRDWGIVPVKRFFRSPKRIVGIDSDKYARLALTMSGVIQRSKDDNDGLQPEKFEGYQILFENELVFKLIDLENIKTSRVGLSNYTGLVSPAYIVLSSKLSDNRFFYYWFISMYYNEVFNHLGGEGVRSALNASDVLCLPTITISETLMHRIADYLDAKYAQIDRAIARQQEVIEKLKEYKLSVITEAVTKGLNPDVPMKDSGIEWIGEIPEHWTMLRLRYIGTCQNGISKDGESFGSGYPFVSYSDVYKNFVVPERASGLVESTELERFRFSVCRGDVFFTRTSETIEEIGLTAVCLNTIDEATFAGFLIRVRPLENTLYPEYSKYYFRSEKHRRFFVKEMNLITRASLGQELLKRLPVLLPPIEEQQEIAEYLDKKCLLIDSVASSRQQVIDKLTEYKKSLIYEIVTGKREV